MISLVVQQQQRQTLEIVEVLRVRFKTFGNIQKTYFPFSIFPFFMSFSDVLFGRLVFFCIFSCLHFFDVFFLVCSLSCFLCFIAGINTIPAEIITDTDRK